jgi:hypothetical protein
VQVLLSRDYRGDIGAGLIDKFMPLVIEHEENGDTTPLIQYDKTNFAYIKHNNLFLVAATRRNANIALIFVFLHKLVEVFTEYFKVLEEESIRDNFVIVYELLDEIMDFGYPQTTETKVLQEFITQEVCALCCLPCTADMHRAASLRPLHPARPWL